MFDLYLIHYSLALPIRLFAQTCSVFYSCNFCISCSVFYTPGHRWHGYLFSHRGKWCIFTCMYVHVSYSNTFECHWNINQYVAVRGTRNVVFFSNKTIIFIRASDSAMFIVLPTITHTLTKLKRLLTFDNFSVPFHSCPITAIVHVNYSIRIQQKNVFILEFLSICLSFFYCKWQLARPTDKKRLQSTLNRNQWWGRANWH